MIIAVYGTLKKDYPANSILNGAKRIKEGYFSIPYTMHNAGPYPYLKKSEQNNDIYLEVYHANPDTEKHLDAYEGYPHLFDKATVHLEENLEAKIYIAGKDLSNQNHHQIIKNGNYGKIDQNPQMG